MQPGNPSCRDLQGTEVVRMAGERDGYPLRLRSDQRQDAQNLPSSFEAPTSRLPASLSDLAHGATTFPHLVPPPEAARRRGRHPHQPRSKYPHLHI